MSDQVLTCETFNETSGTCSKCYDGFGWNSTSKACEPCGIDNCKSCSMQEIEGIPDYWSCETCDSNDYKIDERYWYNHESLLRQNVCINKTSAACPAGKYKSGASCISCKPNCAEC